MKKFISTNRSNPCPICSDLKGKCRNPNSDVVLCMNTTGDINGWTYKGQTKDQLWGKYVKNCDGSDFDRETYRKQREQERQREKARQFSSLSESDRDRESRKLLKQLGLSSKHRQSLLNRGLTASDIESIGFCTVSRGQHLLAPVSPDLAGVNSNGFGLRTSDGFLIPIFNELGQIIGQQLACDDRSQTKYKWLKSGNSSHLATGELPLTFCKGKNDPDVRLAEGVLKPLVASAKLGQNFIGASGGQFASSPKQLERYLKAINPNQVILPVDAGSRVNSHVLTQCRSTYKLVKDLGYKVFVEHWGQSDDKNALDIDEISPDTQTKIIPYEQWDDKYLPELKQDWQKSAHQHWKRHKQFTPALTQNQQFTNFELNPIGSSLLVKGGLGTGKTFNIAEIIKGLPDDVGVIALFATNALALNFCERTGIKHLHRDNAFDELSKPNGRVALCTNSLIHFHPDWFNNKLLVIDEIITVVNHLVMSSTHKKNRKECMELFTQCLKRASRRIFLDGHVADWVIDGFIQRLIGQHQVIKFENQYKSPRPEVEFLIGCEGIKSIKPNDNSAFIPAIISAPKLGLIDDSQIACESYEELLKSVGKQGIRIDSKTVADKKHPAKAFLSNPDKWINEFQPDYVILSPSAQCGIDISIRGYFTDVFSLFTGILTTDAQVQFIGRFRDPAIKHHVFCPEYTRKNQEQFNSPFASTVKKSVNEFLTQDIESITQNRDDLLNQLSQIINDSQDDPYHDAWAILKSQDNYEKANLRDCLLESLIESGYKVNQVLLETNKGSKVLLNETKEKIRRNNCNDYFHSKEITWLEAQQIATNWDASWEDRCSVIRASILDRLPGIERHPLWSPDFIYELIYGNRQMIASCEMNYLLNNPEDTERHQQNLWASVALGGDKFLPDIRSRHQIITALTELGINTFLDPARTWCNSSPELLELVRRGKRKKIKTALGFTPGKDPIKYLGRLLKLVGFDLALKKQKRLNGSENPTRFYGINQVKVNDPIRLAVSEAVRLRYSDESARAEFRVSKWDEFLEKTKPEKIPITTAISRIETISDQPNILINLGLSVTPETQHPTPNIQHPTEQNCPVAIGQMFRWFNKFLGKAQNLVVTEIQPCNGSYVVGLGGAWEMIDNLLDPQQYIAITG